MAIILVFDRPRCIGIMHTWNSKRVGKQATIINLLFQSQDILTVVLFLVPHKRHKAKIAKEQHPTCKASDMLHSDIVSNAVLHRKQDNFTFLGRVRNMKECLGLCCTDKNCELAYLVNNTKCFSTQCADPGRCKIVKDEKKNQTRDVKMSLMVQNDANKPGTEQKVVFRTEWENENIITR